MTQDQLAEISGVSQTSISRYESGKSSPSLLDSARLIVALGKSARGVKSLASELMSAALDEAEKSS